MREIFYILIRPLTPRWFQQSRIRPDLALNRHEETNNMGTTAEQLLEEALKLPEQDRGDIALRLLETLDDTDEISDAELLDELQSRLDEGFDDSLSWDELRQIR